MTRQREPICDEGAEEAVISAAVLHPDALEVALEHLRPDDFWLDRHRIIFQAMIDLDAASTKLDAVTIAGHLRAQGSLDRVGGTPEIGRLLDATPAVAHVLDHARVVADRARQRRVVQAGRTIMAEGAAVVPDLDEFCRMAEQRVSDAAEDRDQVDAAVDLGTCAAAVIEELSERAKLEYSGVGQRCGLVEVDNKLGGWEPGVHVIAGRPAMGKSAYAKGVMRGLVEQTGGLGVFISLEMPKEQLAMRMLSAESKVPLARIRSGTVTSGEMSTLAEAAQALGRLPISLRFCPGATIQDIRSTIRRALRDQRLKFGKDLHLSCVVVDYIQLARSLGRTREEEVSAVSRALMHMAGELTCPILALSQLNRGVESRSDKRPQLSDLRESGAIEQDAYTVQFLYRDEYYFEDSADAGLAEVIVAKGRNVQTGTVKVAFRGEYTLFENDMDTQFAEDASAQLDPDFDVRYP